MHCLAILAFSLQAPLASSLSLRTGGPGGSGNPGGDRAWPPLPSPARAPVAPEVPEALEASALGGYEHPPWLKNCSAIFLDVGSNLGVQVRKLFEPEKYPRAQLLADFTKYLGTPQDRLAPAEKSGLCALGLEPNPAHRERLELLSFAYAQRGWRAHFYPFAAWSEEGVMALNTTAIRASPDDTTGLGVHLQPDKASTAQGADAQHVRTVSLAEFIRSLPPGSVRLMKMDIEGAEWETLAQLVKEDMLCEGFVQSAFVEVHPWGNATHWGNRSAFKAHPRSWLAVQERIRRLAASGRCPGAVTKFSLLDDETYPHDVDDDFRGLAGGPRAAAAADRPALPRSDAVRSWPATWPTSSLVSGPQAAHGPAPGGRRSNGARAAAAKKGGSMATYAIRDGKSVKISR